MDPVEPLDLARLEAHVAGAGFAYTNLQRVAYPAHAERGALLKAHVVDYYLRIADALLPHARGRPIVFRRYPNGIGGEHFYTKDWEGEKVPDAVRRVRVWSESRRETLAYALLENVDALGWFAQTGALEVHSWLARLGPSPDACATEEGLRGAACGLDRPDVLAFDIDPYVRAGKTGVKGTEAGGEPGLAPEDWERAVEVALELRDVLRGLAIPSFVKTSGKRGIHVYVPLVPERSTDEVRAVARTISEHVARRRPDLVTLSYDFTARKGRVFLDYNQNVRGKTLAAPYSLRPTPEATVSAPLSWDELPDATPTAFDWRTIHDRLRERGDPWRGIFDARCRLDALLA